MLKRYLFVALLFLPGIASSSCVQQILDARSRLISAQLLGRQDLQANASAELLALAETPEKFLDVANAVLRQMKDWKTGLSLNDSRLSLIESIRQGFVRFEFEESSIDDFQKKIVETMGMVRSTDHDRLFSILFGLWSKDPSPRVPISAVAFETRKLLLNFCWSYVPAKVVGCYEKLLGRGDLTGPQYYDLMTQAIQQWFDREYSEFDYFYHGDLNTAFADIVAVLSLHVKKVTPRDIGRETRLKRVVLKHSEEYLDWGAEVFGRYAKDLPTIDYRVRVRQIIAQW